MKHHAAKGVSLKYKLVFCLAMLMICALGTYTAVCVGAVRDEFSTAALRSMVSTVQGNQEKLSATLRQLSAQCITLASSSELQEGLNGYGRLSPVEQWERWRRIDDLMDNWQTCSAYNTVRLYLPDSMRFLRNGSRYVPEVESLKAKIPFSTSHGQQFWSIDPHTGLCFCYAPVISGMQTSAYVELSVSLDWFESTAEIMDSVKMPIFLTDQEGNVLLGDSKDNGRLELESGVQSASAGLEDLKHAVGRSDAFLIYAEVEGTPFRLACELSGEVLEQSSNGVVQRMLKACVAIVLAAALLALGMSSWLNRKLNRLTGRMAQLERGELDIQPIAESRDELDQAVNQFADMACQLKKMMDDVRHAEQLCRESELRVLQSQINPHFIANALSCVDAMARQNKTAQVHELIKEIAAYLRLSLNKTWQFTTLERELELVRTYWRIQQARYGSAIELSVLAPAALMTEQILPLTLQTLVENALMHGNEPDARHTFRVELRIRREEQVLLIEVEDNGAGMSEERLEQVRQAIGSAEVSECYGLWNVNRRIIQRYGEDYGLSIHSTLGVGTLCILTMPSSQVEA